MRIIINSTLAGAGGKSVAMNFLKAYLSCEYPDELIVYAPPGRGYEAFNTGKVKIRTVPIPLRNPLVRNLYSKGWWSQVIQREQPDIVFNMGNFALPLCICQATLFHWPYAIYPKSEAWRRLGIIDRFKRSLWLRFLVRSLPYSTVVIAQTKTSAKRLRRYFRVRKIRIIPNAVSLQEESVNVAPLFSRDASRGKIALLCLTSYRPHKNLEVLLPLATRMKRERAPYVIITTVEPQQHSKARRFLRDIHALGLHDYIHNLGQISMEHVPELYASIDALLLPTLLESFSQTYVEAMYFGKTIFTSDRDFARDVCGEAAIYMNPLDPDDIFAAITNAYADPASLDSLRALGRQRVAQMPDWIEVSQMFMDTLYHTVAQDKGTDHMCTR